LEDQNRTSSPALRVLVDHSRPRAEGRNAREDPRFRITLPVSTEAKKSWIPRTGWPITEDIFAIRYPARQPRSPRLEAKTRAAETRRPDHPVANVVSNRSLSSLGEIGPEVKGSPSKDRTRQGNGHARGLRPRILDRPLMFPRDRDRARSDSSQAVSERALLERTWPSQPFEDRKSGQHPSRSCRRDQSATI